MRTLVFEKRKNLRINTIIKVDVFNYFSGKLITNCYITDISTGGIRIESNTEISDEDDVLVKFVLNNWHYFENIRGRIIRSEKESFSYIYGVKFLEVTLIDRIRLWLFSRRIGKSQDCSK